MKHFLRHPLPKWALRLLFVLTSMEGSLAIAAFVVARIGGMTRAGARDGAIVCVGDSNTFGIGAGPGRSYPDQLRELLQANGTPRDVVNLGFPGLTIDRMVQRLETALESCRPSIVIFQGGHNDGWHGDSLMKVPGVKPESPPTNKLIDGMRHLRTWRMAETALHVIRGEIAREEFGGGAVRETEPEPETVKHEMIGAAIERALRGGDEWIFKWLVQSWSEEDVPNLRRLWDAFRRTAMYARFKRELRFPELAYEWEVAMLEGKAVAPVPPDSFGGPTRKTYLAFTRAFSEMTAGRFDEARAALHALEISKDDPWLWCFIRLHEAWIALLERDFPRARSDLEVPLVKLEMISPIVGMFQALGGSALATLLADDSTRLADWSVRHGAAWKEHYWWYRSQPGHEWMVAAECVDAIKGGDPARIREVFDQARRRFGAEPLTAPLRWLFAHPDATLGQVRAGMPMEAPRVSFIGPRRWFFRSVRPDEFRRIVEPQFERIQTLSRESGFEVVVLTYLGLDAVPQNELLSDVAADRGWRLVDFHQIHPLEELARDDRAAYFCADRGHPNEAGYGLMAKDLFEVLVREGLVR